ncbi:hypothetical protein HYPSUDRAFT_90856, partial [Hypholoma sublateritium FD-334 SS-4]
MVPEPPAHKLVIPSYTSPHPRTIHSQHAVQPRCRRLCPSFFASHLHPHRVHLEREERMRCISSERQPASGLLAKRWTLTSRGSVRCGPSHAHPAQRHKVSESTSSMRMDCASTSLTDGLTTIVILSWTVRCPGAGGGRYTSG